MLVSPLVCRWFSMGAIIDSLLTLYDTVNYGPEGLPKGSPAEISKTMMNNQTFDDWTWIYKVNVASYYFTSAAFLPLLSAANDNGFSEPGSILNSKLYKVS
jgi:NAD(P)-dependent dehydrogenase (short-subunit alcohol dehydrogenase family)